MKVTRYFQSCLLIEEGGARILVDPSGDDIDTDFGRLDAVVYTHEHSDHFDAQMAQDFVEQGVAPVYANASTRKKIKASVTEVRDKEKFEIAGINIKAIELPHCLMPDGSVGPQNTGYLFNGRFFTPGDGKELKDFKVENLALPITGPDVSMKDCFAFARQVQATKVIPIHYDKIGAKPEVYETFAGYFPDDFKFKFLILDRGASVEI